MLCNRAITLEARKEDNPPNSAPARSRLALAGKGHADMKKVIGILGGIGAGKSTIARMFGQLGCAVIEADALAREAMDEPDVIAAVTALLGRDVLDDGGRIDRPAVSRQVFADADKLKKLEAIIHPRVGAKRAALLATYQHDPAVVAVVDDVPLLLEKGLDQGCDVLVFVEASRAVRLERVRGRGWDESELDRREKRQLALDMKRDRADYVVTNGADREESFSQVRVVLSQILHCIP